MEKRSFDSTRTSSAMYSRERGASRYAKLAKTRARKRTTGRVFKGVAIALGSAAACVLVVMGIFGATMGGGIFNFFGPSTTQPFYMLMVGIDKDEERANSASFGQSDAAYRTDSMILARVDPPQKQLTLVSIHRDTMVDMGTYGKQKINSAYSFGGIDNACKVVSDYAGVSIPYYVEMDFEGFMGIVDMIGGIEVDVPIDINDNLADAHLSKGLQTLNGTQALALSRARHAYDSYGPGDAYRSANQRMLISAIVKKVLASGPTTVIQALPTMASNIHTNLSMTSLLQLANEFSGMDVDNNVYTGQDPTTSKYIDSLWWEICDTDAWKKMMQRVDAGLSPYESVEDDPTHNGAGGKVNIKNDDSGALSGGTDDEAGSVTGTIEVLNATTSSGLAGRVAHSLETLGATSTKTGNANSQYATSVVVYTSEANKAKAEAVAHALGGQIEAVNGAGQYSTTCDVLVILGSDLKDVD